MRLNPRLAAERLNRVRARAATAREPILPRLAAAVQQGAAAAAAAPVARWTDEPHGRRGSRRVPISKAEASVRRLGRFCFQLPLRDICEAGCKVDLVEPIAADDPVVARLPGLELFRARVAWTRGQSAGLQFERPMHPAVFALLVSRIG
jgi:hypothetical protein